MSRIEAAAAACKDRAMPDSEGAFDASGGAGLSVTSNWILRAIYASLRFQADWISPSISATTPEIDSIARS